MRALLTIGVLAAQVATAPCASRETLNVAVSQDSIRVNGIELRSGPRVGVLRFISLQAAEKALGKPASPFVGGLGVRVYSWPQRGITIQRGWRGPEKDQLFKVQVWLTDSYNRFADKHAGTFSGRLTVDGVAIPPDATLDSLRGDLESRGYDVHQDTAKKGVITIFSSGSATARLQRVEAWCL